MLSYSACRFCNFAKSIIVLSALCRRYYIDKEFVAFDTISVRKTKHETAHCSAILSKTFLLKSNYTIGNPKRAQQSEVAAKRGQWYWTLFNSLHSLKLNLSCPLNERSVVHHRKLPKCRVAALQFLLFPNFLAFSSIYVGKFAALKVFLTLLQNPT